MAPNLFEYNNKTSNFGPDAPDHVKTHAKDVSDKKGVRCALSPYNFDAPVPDYLALALSSLVPTDFTTKTSPLIPNRTRANQRATAPPSSAKMAR